MQLFALGDKVIMDEEGMSIRVRKTLLSLSPKHVLTDFSIGWSFLVGKEAAALGIPLMGVFPHEEVIGNPVYKLKREELQRKARTGVVFEKDYYSFLKNTAPYVKWLVSHVDVVLAYVDIEKRSVPSSILSVLEKSGKRIHNFGG